MGEPDKQLAVSQQIATGAINDKLDAPLLYLSSVEAGWEGLLAEAFHEPTELEGVIASPPPDISLILFRGGAMHMALRPVNGPWNALYMHQGDLLLSPDAGPTYEVRWKGLTTTPTQTFHLTLNKDLFVRTAQEMADYDSARLSLEWRSGFQDPLLTQICFTLWQELEQPSPAGKLYAQTAAQMLAVHLLRHYTEKGNFKEPTQGLTQQQMRRVMDFVQAYLTQDLSLDELAQQAGFSPYHFARMFRRTTGESPHQFVLRQRIERAQRLLKETDLPLAHVALESGFANQSHLTHAFKRYLGVTPRAYRHDYAAKANRADF